MIVACDVELEVGKIFIPKHIEVNRTVMQIQPVFILRQCTFEEYEYENMEDLIMTSKFIDWDRFKYFYEISTD